MFKKISGAILIVSMLCSFISPNIFASDSRYEYARDTLIETKWGEKYINSLEEIIPKVSDKKLSDISQRVKTALNSNTEISYDMMILLEFIDLVVVEEIQKRRVLEDINEEERKKVEKEILIMQKHFGNTIHTMMEDIVADWNSVSRYKETGTMNVSVTWEMPGFSKVDGKLSINNYSNENQSFDSQFSWNINGYVNVSLEEQNESITGESMIDIISKDGAIYMLLKDLELEISNLDTYTEIYIAKLQELAKNNTYIKSNNMDLNDLIGLISNTSLQELQDSIKKLESWAMLEAYKKEGNNYLLRPTKSFCDTAKKLASVFDPFGWETCTENQYRDLLDDYYDENMEITATLWKENVLSIMAKEGNEAAEIEMKWNNKKMISIHMDITSTQSEDDTYFEMNWIIGKSLDIDMNVEDITGNIDMIFHSDMSIASFDANFSYNGSYANEKMKMLISYNNMYLNGSLTFSDNNGNALCSISGPLKADFTKLTMSCVIQNESLVYLGTDSDTIEIDSSFEYNGRYSKNNIDFDVSITSGSAFLDMTLKNTWERVNIPEREIITPENTVDAIDIQDEIYDELYGDLYSDDFEYNFDDEIEINEAK